jgi:hypothetical protein
MTIDGVWVSNRIYWTLPLLTTNNYDRLSELHALKITVSVLSRHVAIARTA